MANSTSLLSSRLYNSFSSVSFSAAKSAASSAASAASTAASSAVSVASTAASVASGAASSAATVASTAATSVAVASVKKATPAPAAQTTTLREEFADGDMYTEYLKDLRMNYEYAGEKVAIFDKFYALLEPGGLWLSLETFVMDMRTRGHSVLWADAAFRAADVEKRGALNKFEYLFAVLSLQKDDRFYRNQRWIELRRRLLFTIYDRGAKGSIDEKDFMELINDISSSQDAPEAMGISNKKWSAAIEAGVQSGGHDFASISQELAMAKLELVQKQSELDELHLTYIQLEKKYCAIKFELADTRALLDERF